MCRFFILIFSLFSITAIQGQQAKSFELLQLVNDLRAQGCQCGGVRMQAVKPVRWNTTLARSASLHAKDMVRNKYFSHHSRSGKDVGDRLDDIGYDWQRVGENIADGYYDARKVLRAWIESPEHCELLMDPGFDEMGAYLEGRYWVQHFGKTRRRRR